MRNFVIPALCGLLCFVQGCQKNNATAQTYVHKYGVALSKKQWQAHGSDGQIVTKTPDGITISRSFSKGVLDGKTTYSFPNSDIPQYVETYNKEALVSRVENFSNGQPKQETIFADPVTHITKVNTWFENGAPRSHEEYLADRLIRGEYLSLNGECESRINNGNGIRNVRDFAGTMAFKETIHDGFLVEQTTLYPNGSPKSIATFRNNALHGTRKTFYTSGALASVEKWENGQKHGLEERYNPNNGTVSEEISWLHNNRTGPTHTYMNGERETTWYYDGKVVSHLYYQQMASR